MAKQFLLANGVDTNIIKITKQLPVNIDIEMQPALGLDYDWTKTDYRLNPRGGINEIRVHSFSRYKK